MSGSPHNQAPIGIGVPLIRRVLSVPTLVSLALAGAFLAFLVTRFHLDLPATWNHIAASNPWFLASALLVYYTTFLFRGARWRLLMRNVLGRGTAVPGVGYYGQLLLLGWFANSVSWFRLGDAYRAYLYSSEQCVSFARTMGTIMAERFLDALLVALLLLVATLLLISRGQGASWPVLGMALVLLALVAAVLLAMGRARGWLVRRLPRRLAGYYQHFHEGTLGSFRQMPAATLWGGLGWL
ncbi:MAG: flippase-like domain-containing protein, partial [Chloroflexota bacterium]